jgi:hypothetical protein
MHVRLAGAPQILMGGLVLASRDHFAHPAGFFLVAPDGAEADLIDQA